MNKPVYLGFPILELSKILMYELWYDYVKPKYDGKLKFCYIDTDSFIVCIRTDYIYKDIAEHVDTRFHTSNYELDTASPKGQHKKVIGLLKDKLREKIMTIYVGLRAKSCGYLLDYGSEDKKIKRHKKVS